VAEEQGKRAHPRVPVRLEVKIPTATMLKVLWTANLSKGGMAIETDHQIAPDTKVTVVLTVPGKTVELPATVKHSTPRKAARGGKVDYFVGVQFGELPSESRAAIEAIIGSIPEPKRKVEEKRDDLFDDSDIDID
jgi:uncharacterized protein (TIGR02266 family)